MTWDKREPDIFAEGRQAFAADKRPSDNPYDNGTSSNREWFRGFRYQKHQSNKTRRSRSNPLGKEAYDLGRDLNANPFSEGTRAYREWDWAWKTTAYQSAHAEGYRAAAEYIYYNPYSGQGYPLESGWDSGHNLAEMHRKMYGKVSDRWFEPQEW